MIMIACLLLATHLHATDIVLTGAGATFPAPLYHCWIDAYAASSGQRVMYYDVGSSQGIDKLLRRRVDFGATDVPLRERELEQVPAPILHIPTCFAAVVLIYSLPEEHELRLTPEQIAGIFSGSIRSWDDRKLVVTTPSLGSCDQDITVVHRSEGSGTTFIFTDYLAGVSAQWSETIGRGKLVRWPVGIGVEGNAMVADFVERIPGSIGYVSQSYAVSGELPVALVRDAGGRFVSPTMATVSAAAAGGTVAAEPYPISGFTYLIVYREQSYEERSQERAQRLVDFLWWAVHEGQALTRELQYARLPAPVVGEAEGIIRTITFDGRPMAPAGDGS